LVIGIIFEFVVIPHELTRFHPGKAGKIFGRQSHFLPLRRNAFAIGPTDRLFERDLLNLWHFSPNRTMAVLDFFSPDVTHRIPKDRLMTKCRRLIANQELTREPSGVQSAVAADALRAFIAALEGNAADITERNSARVSQLCEEFGFDGLTAQLSMFQPSAALRDAEARH
jgi:hypothetical protein